MASNCHNHFKAFHLFALLIAVLLLNFSYVSTRVLTESDESGKTKHIEGYHEGYHHHHDDHHHDDDHHGGHWPPVLGKQTTTANVHPEGSHGHEGYGHGHGGYDHGHGHGHGHYPPHGN